MPFLKILGSGCLLAFALFASDGYRKAREKAFSALDGLVLLLAFAKEEIGAYLTPCDAIFEKFRNDELEERGFLPLLREKRSLADALSLSREKLALPDDAFAVLAEYAERLGLGYREEEIERVEHALVRLRQIRDGEEAALKKNIRLARVLLLSGAVMLILLLL